MAYYNTAAVCLNGHAISIDVESEVGNELDSMDHCVRCGEKLLLNCSHCNSYIRGQYVSTVSLAYESYIPPQYCHSCGKPYPWTEKKMSAIKEAIEQTNQLEDSEKEDFIKRAMDIMNDNPKAKLSMTIINKYLNKLEPELKQITQDLIHGIARKSLKENAEETIKRKKA